MPPNPDLAHINRLAEALCTNQNPEVSAMADKLQIVTTIFLVYHEPPSFKFFWSGFTFLDKPDRQERLRSTLKRIKAILPSGPTLRNGKAVNQKTYRLVKFASDKLAEMDELILSLGVLLVEERFTAYVPYCLGKIRKLPEWQKSPFSKTTWEEVNSGIINGNPELRDLITHIAKTHNYDSAVITRWIEFRTSMVTKDFYVSRTVQDLKIRKLTRRVWRDQNHVDLILKDTDLTTKALCLAFSTFRNDWFTSIMSGSIYRLTKMAQKWLGRQSLLRGDISMGRAYLEYAEIPETPEDLAEWESSVRVLIEQFDLI